MEQGIAAGAGIFSLLFLLLGLVLAVLWVLVPIAVFGIKSRLDLLLGEQRRTNGLLASLLIEMQSQDRSN